MKGSILILIIVIFLVFSYIYSIYYISNYISKKGLKSIVSDIWEGTESIK
jgi:hypothetical protein